MTGTIPILKLQALAFADLRAALADLHGAHVHRTWVLTGTSGAVG